MALAFFQSEVAAGREFPTLTAITRHMGWANVTQASDVLASLKRDGRVRIKFGDDGARQGWELVT